MGAKGLYELCVKASWDLEKDLYECVYVYVCVCVYVCGGMGERSCGCCDSVPRESVCPSGLRGYVQVVMFSNAWVQIPQLTINLNQTN